MRPLIFIKLSVMMLLEYFIWGSWYVTLASYMTQYLHSSGVEIGAAYSALAIATMISPFFVGLVADRFFAAERIMGILHILGGALLFFATQITDNTFFYWIILFYSILYMPTIALSNSIAFNQMTNPGKQFPWIRVFGTTGWILAGIIISYFEHTSSTFMLASASSFTLGIVSFILPNTAPKGKQSGKGLLNILGGEAFVLWKSHSYLVFFIAAIFVCIPLSFYYGWALVFLQESGLTDAPFKMTFGQFSEGLFILAIPFLFNRIGVKKMLIIGMFAWILRYLFFAFGNSESNLWMLYAGIVLHGICYDFFFVTGYMYTEKRAGEKIKNSAQGLFTFATYGLGMYIGTQFSGFVADHYLVEKHHLWKSIWLVPTSIAFIVLFAFIIFFKEKQEIK